MKTELSVWARRRLGGAVWKVFRTYLIVCISFVVLYPLIFNVSFAFRPLKDMVDPSVIWVPKHITLENFRDAMEYMDYLPSLLMTALLSLGCTLFLVFSCSLAGYGFARFRFPFQRLLFTGVLLTIVVPMQTIAIPSFAQIRFFDFFGLGHLIKLFTGELLHVSLYNTPMALLLPALLASGLRGGLYIYVFRQFFKGIPPDLEDAAAIDGSGIPETFFRIVAPTALPPYLVVTILSMVWYWNDAFLSGMFFSKLRTLPVSLDAMGMAMMMDYDQNEIMARQYAGCLLMIIPLFLAYLLVQRFFIQSVDRTGLK